MSWLATTAMLVVNKTEFFFSQNLHESRVLGTDYWKSDGRGWGERGGGDFQLALIFFVAHCLCRNFFFSGEPLCTNFVFRQILLSFEQWNLDLLSMFLCFINYSILTTDQRIQATLMQNLCENVHTVREEEATWSGRLPCALFQSLPSGIPLSQPNITMPYSIHQNSPYVVPSTRKCQSKRKYLFSKSEILKWLLNVI